MVAGAVARAPGAVEGRLAGVTSTARASKEERRCDSGTGTVLTRRLVCFVGIVLVDAGISVTEIAAF